MRLAVARSKRRFCGCVIQAASRSRRVPRRRQPFGMKGDGRLDDMFFQRLAVLDLVFHLGLVFDADDRAMRLAEEGGQSLELALLPFGEGMVVALGAIDPLAEKRADRPAGQLVFVQLAVGHRRRDVIRRGMVGPKTGLGNHVPGDLVVRRVLCELLPQPIDEAVAAKDDDLARCRCRRNSEPAARRNSRRTDCRPADGPSTDRAGRARRPIRIRESPRATGSCRTARAKAGGGSASRSHAVRA